MMFPRRPSGRPAEEPGAGIQLGPAWTGTDGPQWGRYLVLFMRALAALWIAQGLLQWSAFLMPQKPVFDTMSRTAATAMIFFGILDLVAAVGLWLATPWGGAIWLFAASVQIMITLTLPRFFWSGWIFVNFLLILIYFALTWQASRVQAGWAKGPPRKSRSK